MVLERRAGYPHLDPEQVARQRDVQIHYRDGAMANGHKVSYATVPIITVTVIRTRTRTSRSSEPEHWPKAEAASSPHQASYTAEVEQHEQRRRQRGRLMFSSAQWLEQARTDAQCLPQLDARHGMGNCEAGETRSTLTHCHHHLLYRHARAPSSASLRLLGSPRTPMTRAGGSYGSLVVVRNVTWREAAKACLRRCAACTACRHISVRLQPPTCNWYERCGDVVDESRGRKPSNGLAPAAGFRSGPAFPARGGSRRPAAMVEKEPVR